MIAISPKKMTVAEKLSVMEALWSDLCQYSSLESPDWHEAVLAARELQRKEGNQSPINWEEAKQQICKQVIKN